MSFEAESPLDLLKAELIIGADGISLAFNLGCFSPNIESGDTFEVALVAFDDQKGFLVALPASAWDKRVDKRKLKPGTINKVLKVAVGGSTEEDRLQAAEGKTINSWIGWLSEAFVPSISFGEEVATSGFVDRDSGDPCFPFAEALVEAAKDKFQVRHPGEEEVPPDRLTALENQFGQLRGSLEELLKFHRAGGGGGSGYVTAEEVPGGLSKSPPKTAGKVKAKAKVKGPPVGPPPGLGAVHDFPGLDPGTVAAALQAGVPRSQLETISRVTLGRPAKLGDFPAEEEAADGDGSVMEVEQEQEDMPADPMARALVQLTTIVGHLSKKAKLDPLEDALEGLSGSGSVEQPSGLARKHAALIAALKKTFKENLKRIWEIIESNMADEFDLRVSQPNVPGLSFTARGWAEHRSRIMGYARSVRATWTLSGVLDALRNGCVDEARARCCLGLAQLEQESLDHGSFLLAQEFSLEPPAPLSSFQAHALPDVTEMPHTRLMDSRWVDAFAHRLKEVDNYVEMRKKLGQKSKAAPAIPSHPPKTGGKAKGKGGKGKQSEVAAPQEVPE